MPEDAVLRKLQDQHDLAVQLLTSRPEESIKPSELKRLKKAVQKTTENLGRARNLRFDQSDPKIQKVVGQLEEANAAIEKSIQDLENITETLGLITDGVTVAGQLLKLVRI